MAVYKGTAQDVNGNDILTLSTADQIIVDETTGKRLNILIDELNSLIASLDAKFDDYVPKTGGTFTGNVKTEKSLIALENIEASGIHKIGTTNGQGNFLTHGSDGWIKERTPVEAYHDGGLYLHGGSGNTTGYRLILQQEIWQWSNFRLSFAVSSRHTGSGIICVAFGCNSSTVNLANCYAQIKYFGNLNCGGVIDSNSFQLYISNDGTQRYLFWRYSDYNNTYIHPLTHTILTEGTWTTDLSTYGTRKAGTEVNEAANYNRSNIDIRNIGVTNSANNTWVSTNYIRMVRK